ncbi:MAG: PAS domain S-box protein [bacterium]
MAEEKLVKSEADYRAILDTVNDAIFVHDAETGDILDVNRKMCEMYGYTVEEVRSINMEALSEGRPPYTQSDAIRLIRKQLKVNRSSSNGEPETKRAGCFGWK